MTQPIRPEGAGMGMVPEMLLRQVLLEGLVELAGDTHRVEELFGRLDTLRQGSQSEWEQDFRAHLNRMLSSQEGGIHVLVGYPPAHFEFPTVSIVKDTGGEAGSMVGSILGEQSESFGTPSETDPSLSSSTRHTTLGRDWKSNLQIGSWSFAGEESHMLHEVCLNILERRRGQLAVAGVRELDFSESGFQPNPDMYPRTAFVPTIRCTMEWTRRQTLREGPIPTRVTMVSPTVGN